MKLSKLDLKKIEEYWENYNEMKNLLRDINGRLIIVEDKFVNMKSKQ